MIFDDHNPVDKIVLQKIHTISGHCVEERHFLDVKSRLSKVLEVEGEATLHLESLMVVVEILEQDTEGTLEEDLMEVEDGNHGHGRGPRGGNFRGGLDSGGS